jgi:flagellar protein FlaI
MLEGRMARRVNSIVELIGLDPETSDLITNTVFEWLPATDKFKYLGYANLFDKMMARKNMTPEDMFAEYERRTDIIKWMVMKNIRFYKEVAVTVSRYYKEPEKVIAEVRKELETRAAES